MNTLEGGNYSDEQIPEVDVEIKRTVTEFLDSLSSTAISIDTADKVELPDKSRLNVWTMTVKEGDVYVGGKTVDGKEIKVGDQVYCSYLVYDAHQTTILYFADKEALKKNIFVELDKISKNK